ncbi:MAG: ketoacyl-ACP synthase III [Proteobacteria bacterium]|nr:ketoacyl-ACP synthase III [Pseudomonadota bacterium]MBU1716844.1 ketoacyl-ACP synthase III [Pseudomonadota bacterium]
MSKPVILGTGSCLPERVLANTDLEKMVDTSDEWIASRTGIRERRIAGNNQKTSMIAAEAGRQAMKMAGLSVFDLDVIMVATISSEMTMPSCACLVQKELGAVNAYAFDLNAACSGFLYSLDLADKFVRADPTKKILVIGAETLSSRTNWQDRNTCVLFGDGAGACVVGAADNEQNGILCSKLFSDGSLWELLSMNAAPSMNPYLDNGGLEGPVDFSRLGSQTESEGSCIHMVGKDVFKYAVRAMEDAIDTVLTESHISLHDLKLLIPHQANIRILNNLAERLDIDREKIYINVQKYGNTSAASIPIALDEANREGRLQQGDLLLMCAFGGGFTWGAMVMSWQ